MTEKSLILLILTFRYNSHILGPHKDESGDTYRIVIDSSCKFSLIITFKDLETCYIPSETTSYQTFIKKITEKVVITN